jgi:hypothetical protein
MFIRPRNIIRPGDYLRNCDICGRTAFRSELVKDARGFIVHTYHKLKYDDDIRKRLPREKPFKGD